MRANPTTPGGMSWDLQEMNKHIFDIKLHWQLTFQFLKLHVYKKPHLPTNF